QLGELAQDLLRAFVGDLRRHRLNLHDLVAALPFVHRRRHALLSQPQLLSGLRAGRNAQQRAAVDGRNLHLGAQRRLRHRHRNGEMDVVALTLENRMLTGANHDVQIAGTRAHRAGIASSGEANALAVTRARLDADLQRLAALHASFAVTRRTHATILATSAAARAWHIELHAAALLRDLALAVALRA